MAKTKFILPDEPVLVLACRCCGEERTLDEYRVYKSNPLMRMDFCITCERRHGTMQCYRRFNAYGTPEITQAVFSAARTPAGRRSADQARLIMEPSDVRAPESHEELIKQEIARRELCRRRLVYYVQQMMPEYMPGWFHQDLCRRLEKFMRDVEEERSPRLIVAVPPRHGKSKLASDMFPSWVLGKHPEWPIILASYNQDLPLDNSRSIRDRLNSGEHRAIYPDARVRSDAKGVEHWKTTKDGGVKAIGVGGGLTGFGGKILIADDLIKDAEAAGSELILKNTWDWYQMVFRSRLAPGGGILLIGTRWHWNDPSGRAIEIDEEAIKAGVPDWERENWDIISYPAIAEGDEYLMRDGSIQTDPEDPAGTTVRLLRAKGGALHPERYPVSEMRKIKNTLTPTNWSALYQQKPTPEEGSFFIRDNFRYMWLDPAYRSLCRIFMCVDYAIGKKTRNDYTVMGVFALDSQDNLWVLDIRRGRWGTDEITQNVVSLVKLWKPEVYAGERGQIHMAVWPVIQKALAKDRLYISVDETLVPIQDKETRARPLQGRMQQRKLLFSYDGHTKPDIYDSTERELLQFPNGAHDDIVDCLAWGARLALQTSLPRSKAPPAKKGWEETLRASAKIAGTSHMAS